MKKVKRNSSLIGVALFLLVIPFYFYILPSPQGENQEGNSNDTIQPIIEYNLPLDSFNVVRGTIQKNQYFAEILLKYGISYPMIEKIVEVGKDTFDIKKIRTGNNYVVLCSGDSLSKAQCFIYEISLRDYVVFDFRDSIYVYKDQKEVTIQERSVSATIESSLYLALDEMDVSPALTLELANIYAWTIDFYKLFKGDRIDVIYDELYIENEFAGIGRIKAALFNHQNNDFYAFYFEQNGKGDYFDEEAKSLRKSFLKAPLKYSRISSGFTKKRFHPVQKRWKAHLGTDYAAPTGTPIMTVGDGTVIEAGYKKYNGNYVKVRHNSTYTTQYLHMSKIGKGITKGKFVRQGDIIGYVGSTGLATGPHVCFRFWKNGQQVNHRREKFPPAEPIMDESLDEFGLIRDSLSARLSNILF